MNSSALFESYNFIGTGVFVVDYSENIVFWNRALEQLSYCKASEVLGKNLFEIFPHLDIKVFRKRLQSVLLGGPPEIFSAQLHKYIIPCPLTEGGYRYQNTSVLGMRTKYGNTFAIFSIQDTTNELKQIENARKMRDVAILENEERKKVEEKLNQTVVELEKNKQTLVEQSGALLLNNEHLAKSEKQLREMNAAKDLLFSIIAHDLRSPLQGLIGYTNLLITDRNELSEEESITFLTATHQLALNLNSLIDNLLQWAKLQSEKIVFDGVIFNAGEIVRECMQLLAPVAAKKEITLSSWAISPTIFAFGDTHMIKTVLRNLISNALKFTPRKGVITMNARVLKDAVEFSVADTGVGMRPEQLERIFDIQKAKSTNGTEQEEGSGLGLVLCKEFVVKNRGEIRVESKLNNGTTFSFTLPLPN